ncbi:MAG TPA: hypothetical protein ENH84_00850 [Phycisphaerae bacterium]|nr:hypothetical protein [Phycisphaerae bacterium]
MDMSEKPVHVIINPKSGHGGQKLLLRELRTEMQRIGRELIEYVTTSPGDATRHARRIAPNASAVIAWGGDGTANEVANGLAGTAVPLLLSLIHI